MRFNLSQVTDAVDEIITPVIKLPEPIDVDKVAKVLLTASAKAPEQRENSKSENKMDGSGLLI